MSKPFLTVFTPSYNRAHTLGRVYESLVNQTCIDFEWVIVDDGSEDDTQAKIRMWESRAPFPVRYFRQPHRGKHVAVNTGVRQAEGKFFLVFDSDDSCVPAAVGRFKVQWEGIPHADRERYSTLSALSMDSMGKIVGSAYPRQLMDIHDPCEQFMLRRGGERWGINRTEVMREYPYPEIDGEYYIPEAIVWNRMALRYSGRFFNEALRIYMTTQNGITSSVRRILSRNPRGTAMYYRELMTLSLPPVQRTKAVLSYLRYAFR